MFKDLSGSYPNKWNTLQRNRYHGGFTVKDYAQKFNNGDTIRLQVISDSATVPSLKIYDMDFSATVLDTIAGTLDSTVTGTDTRYWYSWDLDMTAYNDNCIFLTIEQDGDTLTSEPVEILDLSDLITEGRIKYVKYTNLDRGNSDLDDYFIDWANRDYMFFYIEGIDRDASPQDETEVLDGSQSKTIINGRSFSGTTLKTGPVPDYMVDRMIAVSNLDVFMVNAVEYIKESSIEPEPFGGSTLSQFSLELTEKNAIGINIDDLGIEDTTDTVEWHKEYSSDTVSANFDIEEPDGYLVSNILIQHAATSVPASVNVDIGYTALGSEIASGPIFKSASRPTAFQPNMRDDFDAASRIYFTFSGGAGFVLRIKVLFQLNDIP